MQDHFSRRSARRHDLGLMLAGLASAGATLPSGPQHPQQPPRAATEAFLQQAFPRQAAPAPRDAARHDAR